MADCKATQGQGENDASRDIELILCSSFIKVRAPPLSVLSCLGFYMIKIRVFGYTLCICTHRQTLGIPLSLVTHALKTSLL